MRRLAGLAMFLGACAGQVSGPTGAADLAGAPDLVSAPAPDLAGGPVDGGGAGGDLAPASTGPTRYLPGVLHAPLTSSVLDGLGAVLSANTGRKSVFAKVGDSITADTNFLDCFAGSDVMLDTYSALEPTRAFFNATAVDGTNTSWNRTSLAATVGWNASNALAGSPSPIEQELQAIAPAFAVVMFGTNQTDPCCVESFEHDLTAVVDALLGKSVIPILSTIPPRADATANALVPDMNAVVRAVAQHRQVPYMDFWQTLINLPSYGLYPDGVHPAPYVSGGGHPCWLTTAGLTEGINQRNLITLTALDRMRRFLLEADSQPPPDADPPQLAGDGSWTAPLEIDALAFVDVNDTSKSMTSTANVYSCAPQDESGPEVVYKLVLNEATHLRMRVFVDAGVDVDLQWLSAPSPTSCLARNDKLLDLTAGPGTFYLAVDTFVSGGVKKSGPYRLTIIKVP
jgi:hypothetical protein